MDEEEKEWKTGNDGTGGSDIERSKFAAYKSVIWFLEKKINNANVFTKHLKIPLLTFKQLSYYLFSYQFEDAVDHMDTSNVNKQNNCYLN